MFPISLKTLGDQERHDYILKSFILNNKSLTEQRKHKRDIDVIREHHKFLWNDDDDNEDSWEIRLAKRYYDKLFKEYCIADLTRHKENKIALRWRTESEVVAGIGQFQCGSRKCMQKEGLRSWEVNFAYKEQGEPNNALVKLRLCPQHSDQLNYTSKKREVKRLKHMERQKIKDNKRHGNKKSPKANQTPNNSDTESNMRNDAPTTFQDNDSSSNMSNNEEVGTTEDKQFLEESEAIWRKTADVELEPTSRESEFERYLEELLL